VRFLIATETGRDVKVIKYERHFIVDGHDSDEALDKYNNLHNDISGTVIAKIDPYTRINVRSGPIDEKKMLHLYNNDVLLPVADKADFS